MLRFAPQTQTKSRKTRAARSLSKKSKSGSLSAFEPLEQRHCCDGNDVGASAIVLEQADFLSEALNPRAQARLTAEISVQKLLQNDGAGRYMIKTDEPGFFSLQQGTNGANLVIGMKDLSEVATIKYQLPITQFTTDVQWTAAQKEVEAKIEKWYTRERNDVTAWYDRMLSAEVGVLPRLAKFVSQWKSGMSDAGWVASNGLTVVKDFLPVLIRTLNPAAGFALTIGGRGLQIICESVGRAGTATMEGLIKVAGENVLKNKDAELRAVDAQKFEFLESYRRSFEKLKPRVFVDDTFKYQDLIRRGSVGSGPSQPQVPEKFDVELKLRLPQDYKALVERVNQWAADNDQALKTHVLASELEKSVDQMYADALIALSARWSAGVKFDDKRQKWYGTTNPPQYLGYEETGMYAWLCAQSMVLNDLDIADELNRIGFKPARQPKRR